MTDTVPTEPRPAHRPMRPMLLGGNAAASMLRLLPDQSPAAAEPLSAVYAWVGMRTEIHWYAGAGSGDVEPLRLCSSPSDHSPVTV